MLKGFQNEVKTDAGAAVGSQLLDFGSQNLQSITKTASKIFEISRLRRGCVFGMFWGGPGCENGMSRGSTTIHVWTNNRKSCIRKGVQKAMLKKCRITINKYLKIMPKWMPQFKMFHTCSKKAEMHKTVVFTIQNVVLCT